MDQLRIINFNRDLYSKINLEFKTRDLETIFKIICFHNKLSNLKIHRKWINHLCQWLFKMCLQIKLIIITIWISIKIKVMGFHNHKINLLNMEEDSNKLRILVLKNLNFKINNQIQILDLLILLKITVYLNKISEVFKHKTMQINNLKINFVTYRIWAATKNYNPKPKIYSME